MKYVDEFRDPDKLSSLLRPSTHLTARRSLCHRESPLHIMEVCGGHTHSIFRYGIANMLPAEIEFVHGPGCPVCVLPMGRVDDCVAIAETPGVIFTTFGDAMRVPGSKKSLLQAKADGADVRMVYSPLDALGAGARQSASAKSSSSASASRRRCRRRRSRCCRPRRKGLAQFLALLQSHHHHSDDQGDPRIARSASRRLSWPRPCVDGDRHARL